MTRPAMRVSGATIGAPDPGELGRFYSALLGWPSEISKNWAQIRSPEDTGLSRLDFEIEPDHVRPTWPSEPGRQQIMTTCPPRWHGPNSRGRSSRNINRRATYG